MNLLLRLFVTISLILIGCWVLYFNYQLRTVRYNTFTYSEKELRRLRYHASAQYVYGMRSWNQMELEKAEKFFRQAISQDVLYLDAWLKFAEIEVNYGNREKAVDILNFTANLTDHVFRWKWPQMILAKELNSVKTLYNNANFLISRKILIDDTLQLIHIHHDGNVSDVLPGLAEENWVYYLDWLMRWSLTNESLEVWHAMNENAIPCKEKALKYASFLLEHKRIIKSDEIWRRYTGETGITNPGFEKYTKNIGFDWHYWDDSNGHWKIRQVDNESTEGDYSLRIQFNGSENSSFLHCYQIFVADPGNQYRITYELKSKGLSTDQRPFVEIYSYDKTGLYIAGPMINSTQGWHEEHIDFEMPEDCFAAVIRIRRVPSKRFDSKIRGTLWMDNFRLQSLGSNSKLSSKGKSASQISRGIFHNNHMEPLRGL